MSLGFDLADHHFRERLLMPLLSFIAISYCAYYVIEDDAAKIMYGDQILFSLRLSFSEIEGLPRPLCNCHQKHPSSTLYYEVVMKDHWVGSRNLEKQLKHGDGDRRWLLPYVSA